MKKKKPELNESIHSSIKGRKKYKAKLWLVFGILFVVLLGCSAMFTFANYTWNPDEGFTPAVDPKETYQIILVVLGAVISIAALVGTFLYCWFDIGKFYRSQIAFQKTPKFRELKAKALKQDLTALPKSTIKWYKKLGYITGQEKRDILEAKKAKKNKTKDKENKKEKNN